MARDSRAHWLRTGYRSYRVEDGESVATSGRSSDTIADVKEDILSSDDPRPVRVWKNPGSRGARKYAQPTYVATYVRDGDKVRRYIEEGYQ